jgi:hypothetical protein
MATTLNAGTASSGAAISADTTGILQLQSGSTPTTAVTIDTSQNVGIGTTSPKSNGANYTTLTLNNATNGGVVEFTNNNTTVAQLYNSSTAFNIYTLTDKTMNLSTSGTGAVVFNTAGGERMRISSTGVVGVGVVPSAWGSVVGAVVQVSNAHYTGSAGGMGWGVNLYNDTGGSWRYIDAYAATHTESYGGAYYWYNAPVGTAGGNATLTERMRLNSVGNLSVGTTSDIARIGAVFDGNSNNGCVLRTSTNASGAGFLYFQQDTNTCGSVVRVGTTSAVTYSSTSDYRLKENVMPMTDGLDKVARLKPVTYTWKQGGESAEGFIAHELAEVCPDAVVGTKDQVETYLDEDGNEQTRPKYQSIDTSFLVATLTAAIQEQQALITQLQADVAALKGAK